MENYSLAEEVLGVPSLEEANALHKAFNNLTGLALDAQLFEAECARLDNYNTDDWSGIPPADQESITTLHILRQIFEEGQIKYSNVLQHWPMYEAHYRQLGGIAVQDPGTPRVLQVGCLTAFSSAAFAALARDVYKATPVTIDLTASNMRTRHSNYVVTDALKLGIASNSMRLAQTNCLLHMLESPGESDFQNQAMQLFSEMYRVVQPGGHIILREMASGLDVSERPTYDSRKSKARFEEFKTELVIGLARAGFRSILMEPATEITGVKYLFDSSRDFSRYETHERAATVVVSASKPS